LTENPTNHLSRYSLAQWALIRVVTMFLAIVLMIGFSQSASAFDCLAYKPVGARGQWHADVVVGKICWYGPNWRSFLPKPKLRVENSSATNNKPELSAGSTSLPAAVTNAETQPDLPALRKATPTEAAALINAISLEFDPAPPPAVPTPPKPVVKRHGLTEIAIIFGALAIGGVAGAMVAYRRRQRRVIIGGDAEPKGKQRRLERLPVSPPIAPLQPLRRDLAKTTAPIADR
jgi:hypothetical protein